MTMFYSDYAVIRVQLDANATTEEAARTARTQRIPRVGILGGVKAGFNANVTPRTGEFEFTTGVNEVLLDFTGLGIGRLTQAQSEEIVRTAKLLPAGTLVEAWDNYGTWAVKIGHDGNVSWRDYAYDRM